MGWNARSLFKPENSKNVRKVNLVEVENGSDEEVERVRTLLMIDNGKVELPCLHGRINGIEMKMAFDTGANISCMSYKTALKHIT